VSELRLCKSCGKLVEMRLESPSLMVRPRCEDPVRRLLLGVWPGAVCCVFCHKQVFSEYSLRQHLYSSWRCKQLLKRGALPKATWW